MEKVLTILLVCCAWCCAGQEDEQQKCDTVAYTIGNDKMVNIVTHLYNKPTLNLLVVHDDENTSVEVAKRFVQNHGGRLTELSYGGMRNISFNVENKIYAFDPNGMFTQPGANRSLRKYGHQSSTAAINEVQCLADTVIKIYATEGLNYIVTLHNNTEGMFNINSYQKDRQLIKTARKVYINPAMDPDDLVFVTDEIFFNFFKERKINTILQSDSCLNDGSLSVWAAYNNIPYINIEIQHGHFQQQYEILCWVKELLYSKETNYLAGSPKSNSEEVVEAY